MNLIKKGDKVDLVKGKASVSKILVGLGWDAQESRGDYEFDLDASAFLLGKNGKVIVDGDFIFYGNLAHRSGAVQHMGDDLVGGNDGDDEQIKVDLAIVPAAVEKICFTVTIYDYDVRKQNFGQVNNAYIRIVDEEDGSEMVRYDLGEDFSVETAVIVAELNRSGDNWKFSALGQGVQGGLYELCLQYGVNV